MIIFGKRKRSLKSEDAYGVTCQNCGEKDCLIFTQNFHYFHIFWIPVFPYRFYGRSYCSNCDQELKERQMPLEVQEAFERFKQGVRRPLWSYSGLFLISLLVFAVLWIDGGIKDRNKEFSENPMVYDVIVIKKGSRMYSPLRIVAVRGDSIDYIISDSTSKYSYKAREMDQMGYYKFDTLSMHKRTIKEMAESGQINHIYRP